MKDVLPENDDVRVQGIEELVTPDQVLREIPSTTAAARVVFDTRQQVHRILHGVDDRLLVVVGPCSIHDPIAALEYARGLVPLIQHWQQ